MKARYILGIFSLISVGSAAAMAGCSSGSGSFLSSDGGVDSSTDGGGSSPCPAVLPSGGTCPKVGLECEYSDDPRAGCGTYATCGTKGWTAVAGDCMPLDPKHICPAARAALDAGSTCSVFGTVCLFPDDSRCDCSSNFFGGPMPVDGGVTWTCSQPETGCPAKRPRIGSACSVSGHTCTYGPVCGNGVQMDCKDGYWQRELIACAL